MASSTWELSQIAKILPLDEQSLQEILEYSSSLSKDAAADHLRDILGTSPKALEFISSFNSRREAPREETHMTASAPETARKQRKKKAPLNKPFNSRRPDDYGNMAGAYQKKDEEDYMAGSSRPRREPALASTLALSEKPEARQLPIPAMNLGDSSPKRPPTASGPLISDLPNVRAGSRNVSRTASPAPKTTISVSGGAAMHGASSTLQDLDSAIRALEIQTNPALSANEPTLTRACSCLATRHPLLVAAPNCRNCGKIICVKEGIGPCTFCSHPLLSPTEINAMIGTLREERGRERMSANNASYRRADLASTPRPFSGNAAASSTQSASSSLTAAEQHKDKLLTFQAQNASRTRIIDEAADYDTPSAGQSMWSSPVERAAQLKRQQKVLREQEWSAKPEWQKRQMVVSIDVKGGKAVKRMTEVQRPDESDIDGGEMMEPRTAASDGPTGTFSKNPLMGGLVRPIWHSKEKEPVTNGDPVPRNRSRRRRVQDDEDDNEAWILDGGVYGGKNDFQRTLGVEEHAYG